MGIWVYMDAMLLIHSLKIGPNSLHHVVLLADVHYSLNLAVMKSWRNLMHYSNFWFCGGILVVWPFKWRLFSGTFTSLVLLINMLYYKLIRTIIECMGETCDVTILVKTSLMINNYTNKYSCTFVHVLSIDLGRVLGVLHLNLTSCVWSLEKCPTPLERNNSFFFFIKP